MRKLFEEWDGNGTPMYRHRAREDKFYRISVCLSPILLPSHSARPVTEGLHPKIVVVVVVDMERNVLCSNCY